MKRLLCMIICITFLMSGCANKDMANFYYQRNGFIYDAPDGVIVSEKRDITSHATHLAFLISLYLLGPQNQEYHSPFPPTTKLQTVERNGNNLTIILNDISEGMTDAQFTLACCCLTMTVLELASAEQVTIVSGSRSMTLSQDLITLYDNSGAVQTPTGGTQ